MEKLILYKIANAFFFVFHLVLIFFNLFGWVRPGWRKWNLLTLLLIAFSWFVLGIFYGFGYCFLTDWHWDIRERLGYRNDSHSYVHFLLTELTPFSFPENVVDVFTAIFFFLAVAISIYTNVTQWRHHRLNARPAKQQREKQP